MHYVLKSQKDNGLYIGYTGSLDKRLEQHNKGICKSTSTRKPFHLVYYEAYASQTDARLRERRLKSSEGSYLQLAKRINNSLLA